MTVRYYSSTATPKTLSVTINAGATSMQLSDAAGLPTSYPYTMAVNFGDSNMELVSVTNAAGTTFDIDRAFDGTSATSHTAGATVQHVSSAIDFADSRAHENASNGVHGLSPTEDLMGTDSAQTLSNKTFINATGSFLDIDINSTASHVVDMVKSPAGTDTNTFTRIVNGTDEGLNIANNGRIRILNTPAMDALNTNRRFQITLSNGTTETFYVNTSGMVVSSPRSGALASQAGFKVIIPADAIDRPAFQVRDSTDAIDRFQVHAAGHVDIVGSNAAVSQLDVIGAAGQSASYMRVQNSGATTLFFIDNDGQAIASRRMDIANEFDASNAVRQVRGFVGSQTGDLTQWFDAAENVVAAVNADGTIDCTALTATSGIFTAAADWTVASQAVAVKAGTATVNLTLTRNNTAINADASGNIADTAVGTVDSDYRPHTVFGSNTLTFQGTNGFGDGSVRLQANTGDVTLVSWSSNGTLAVGTGLQLTLTYAIG